MSIPYACSLCLLALLAPWGCSSDQATDVSTAACNDYCDAEQAAACETFSSAEECYELECHTRVPPTACQRARQSYYKCLASSPDICSATACSREYNALFDACA